MNNGIGYRLKNDKKQKLEEFYQKYVEGEWIEKFIEIDEKYKSNTSEIEADIKLKFDEICKNAISLQKSKGKGSIKYIYFSSLYTNIIEDKAEYRVDFFDKNWFLDKVECTASISLDFIFDSLFSQIEELKHHAGEYGRTITPMYIENIKLKESKIYNILAIEFLKDIINKLVEIPSYKEMDKSKDIVIMAGEYMDRTDLIYPVKEEKREG